MQIGILLCIIEELRKKIDETMVAKIAKRIKSWKPLAPSLGLNKVDVSEIDVDGSDEQDKKKRMLNLWMKREGNRATYYNLVQAFNEDDDQEMIDYVYHLLGT